MRNGQLKPAYNVQIAVNSEHITGIGAFSNRTDSGTFVPFLHHLEKMQGRRYEAVVANAGYESLGNYLYLDAAGQISFIKPINCETSKTKRFKAQVGSSENMHYHEDEDCYVCAAGRKLELRRENTTKNSFGQYETTAYYRLTVAAVPYAMSAVRLQTKKQRNYRLNRNLESTELYHCNT